MFLFLLVKNWLLWQRTVAVVFYGKSGTCHLLLSHCRYFDRSLTEMCLELSCTLQTNFVQTTEFDSLSWQLKC